MLFGSSVSIGDFNNDGYDDVAVGVPNDTPSPSSSTRGGAVNLIYGSPMGLNAWFVPDMFLTQDSPNMQEASENDDRFGFALATGDYDSDGFEDLAIGIPSESVSTNTIEGAGAVSIVYGSTSGLSAKPSSDGSGRHDQIWTQNSAEVQGKSQQGDKFGSALA